MDYIDSLQEPYATEKKKYYAHNIQRGFHIPPLNRREDRLPNRSGESRPSPLARSVLLLPYEVNLSAGPGNSAIQCSRVLLSRRYEGNSAISVIEFVSYSSFITC